MKELWIHAGMPKNGSSALQVFFAKFSKELLLEDIDYLELSDISDAKNGKITSGNGALLARAMLPTHHEAYYEEENPERKLIDAIIKSEKKIQLVSSEFFIVVPIDKLIQLRSALNEKNITLKLIYYVRRQDQYLMSAYMQRVKRHGFTGLPDDFAISEYKKIHFLNYYGLTKEYKEALGETNVLPFIYESTENHHKGLTGHFLSSILGFCPEWVKSDPVVNTSPSPLEIKLMLTMNKYKPRMEFSDFVIQNSIDTGRSDKHKNHAIFSQETTLEIDNYFKEQNNKFTEAYCINEEFPSPEKKETIDIKSINFTPNEVVDIITGIIVQLDRRLHMLEKTEP